MANKIITAKTTIDIRGEQLQPYFGSDLLYTDPYWYCSECEDGIGSEPGFAKIIIPNKQNSVDEAAFSVAYNPDGPLAQIKHGSPVAIRRRYTDTSGNRNSSVIWAGKVRKIKNNTEDDCLELLALDARDELKDVRVCGRYVYDGAGSLYFQQGWSAHFNPGGRPNCIFTPGGTPVFAPNPDYGLSNDDEPADPSERSTTKVCYWTLFTELSYFRAFYAYETPEDTLAASARTAAQIAWPMLVNRFPDWVTWPVGFGSDIDTIALTNFNSAVGQNNSAAGGARKGRDLQVKGHAFIGQDESGEGIFDMIFSAAGGYSYYLDYLVTGAGLSGITNILTTVPKRWLSPASSIDLSIAVGGAAKDSLKDVVTITESDFEESSETTITRAVALGAIVKIETRVSSRAADYVDGIPALLPWWTPEQQDAFLADVVALSGGSGLTSLVGFQLAAAKWWWVLTTWYLNPAFQFQAGTDQASFPRATVPRPIWPTLLSFGSLGKSNDMIPYPIRAEAYDSGTWGICPEQDGLQIFDNGVIYMPGLRDVISETAGTTDYYGSFKFNGTPWSEAGGKLDIRVCDVRATIGIPCDHRLMYAVRSLADSNANATTFNTFTESPDSDKFDSSFSRSIIVDYGSLYDLWLRYQSTPIPQTAGGLFAPDLADSGSKDTSVRNDFDMLQSNADRLLTDKFSLSSSGGWTVKGSFVTTVKPGTQVNKLVPVGGDSNRKPYYVRKVIGRRRWTSDKAHDDNGNEIFINKTKLLPV